MNRWGTYQQAAEGQDDIIRDRLFNSDIDEEKHEESLDYIYGLIKKDYSDEYLVDGAVLWCEKATQEPVEIDGLKYYANRDGTSRLRVKHQSSIGEKANALITDCKKDENIFSFGNCTLPLSAEDKEKLKENFENRIKGTCNCLMEPDRVWDEYPRFGLSAYSYDDIRAITMNAGLFCKRGAWILPITSGQEKDYIDSVELMTGAEFEFAMEFDLTEEQLVIFKEMQEYFKSYPELKVGNTIFAFEGLGDFTGGKNKYHPNGQFGAIFVYCKDGRCSYLTKEASTLPDDKSNAVIKDGVYQTVYTSHRGYQALQLREHGNVGNSDIPAVRYDGRSDKPDTANGINLHAAGDLYTNSGWSEGCLTVKVSEYYEFGSAVGFLDVPRSGADTDQYSKLKEEFPGNAQITYKGYIVVNREYMEENNKELFFE